MSLHPVLARALVDTVTDEPCQALVQRIYAVCRGSKRADVVLALSIVVAGELIELDPQSFDAVVESFPDLLRMCATFEAER